MFGSLCLAFLLLVGLLFPGAPLKEVRAEGETEIWTYQDLLKIAEDPAGSYVMMADVDLKGKVWTPVDFSGTLDGNGHAILNAQINSNGSGSFLTYDGNMISYDTLFSGFFSSLAGASVRNVKFLGTEVSIDSSEPTFVGGIAGYMENSEITGCSIYGRITLYTTGASFGVGGIAGFGNGVISGTSSDMTLVCVDKDRENKDEQFLGGAYAAGYIDLENNEVRLDGYDSDHGYVHDGGLVGMYILYPEGTEHEGFITGNTVSGQITFFEDNEDRRAYCEAYIGEIMNWSFAYDEEFSAENFAGNEVFDYDTDLLPHSCEEPEFEQEQIPSTESTNGYVKYTCKVCGYSYFADFMPVVGNYTAPEETAVPGDPEAITAEPEPVKSGNHTALVIIILLIAAVVIALAIILVIRRKRSVQRRRSRRLKDRRR